MVEIATNPRQEDTKPVVAKKILQVLIKDCKEKNKGRSITPNDLKKCPMLDAGIPTNQKNIINRSGTLCIDPYGNMA